MRGNGAETKRVGAISLAKRSHQIYCSNAVSFKIRLAKLESNEYPAQLCTITHVSDVLIWFRIFQIFKFFEFQHFQISEPLKTDGFIDSD